MIEYNQLVNIDKDLQDFLKHVQLLVVVRHEKFLKHYVIHHLIVHSRKKNKKNYYFI
jgi:hypothetical protein